MALVGVGVGFRVQITSRRQFSEYIVYAFIWQAHVWIGYPFGHDPGWVTFEVGYKFDVAAWIETDNRNAGMPIIDYDRGVLIGERDGLDGGEVGDIECSVELSSWTSDVYKGGKQSW